MKYVPSLRRRSGHWGESGRGEALSGSFLGREGPQKSTPYPGFKLEFKKHTSNPKMQLQSVAVYVCECWRGESGAQVYGGKWARARVADLAVDLVLLAVVQRIIRATLAVSLAQLWWMVKPAC